MRRSLRKWVAVPAVAAIAAGTFLFATPATAAGNIVIWTDVDRAPAVRTLFANGYKGSKVTVVVKDFGKIRDDLLTVAPDAAPDVIMGANDWIGQLAVNGSIVKLNLAANAKAGLSTGAVQAFNYRGSQYGTPVAVENIALITNANLVKKQPTTFAELEKQALNLQRTGAVDVGLAIQQGAAGDAYHMYPLFSGLGGYIFGVTPNDTYNVSNVGVYNKTFAKNANIINGWNKEGLINSKVDGDTAKAKFLAGRVAFWVTGPWNLSDIKKVTSLKYRITPVPTIVPGLQPVPFIGVQGVMLTKYAKVHGVEAAARSLVTEYMPTEKAQYQLSALNDRFPANIAAGNRVTNLQLKAFGAAGTGGIPIPNVSQMNSVWTPLASAWVSSTKGAGAIPAGVAFAQAQVTIKKAVATGQ